MPPETTIPPQEEISMARAILLEIPPDTLANILYELGPGDLVPYLRSIGAQLDTWDSMNGRSCG